MIYADYKREIQDQKHLFLPTYKEGFDYTDPHEDKILETAEKSRKKLNREEKKYLRKRHELYLKEHRTLTTVISREEQKFQRLKEKKISFEKTYRSLVNQRKAFQRKRENLKLKISELEKDCISLDDNVYHKQLELDKCKHAVNFHNCCIDQFEQEKEQCEERLRDIKLEQSQIDTEIPVLDKDVKVYNQKLDKARKDFEKLKNRKKDLLQTEYGYLVEKHRAVDEAFAKHQEWIEQDTIKGTLGMLLSIKDLLREEYRKKLGSIEFESDELRIVLSHCDRELLTLQDDLYEHEREYYKILEDEVDHDHRKSLYHCEYVKAHSSYDVFTSVLFNEFKEKMKKESVDRKYFMSMVKKTRREIEQIEVSFLRKTQKELKILEMKISKMKDVRERLKRENEKCLIQEARLVFEYGEKVKKYQDQVKRDAAMKRELAYLMHKKMVLTNQLKLDTNNFKLSRSNHQTIARELDRTISSVKKEEYILREHVLKRIHEKDYRDKNELADLKNRKGRINYKLKKLKAGEVKKKRVEAEARNRLNDYEKTHNLTEQKMRKLEKEIRMVKERINQTVMTVKESKRELDRKREERKDFSIKIMEKNSKEMKMIVHKIRNMRERILELKKKENLYISDLEIKKAKMNLNEENFANLQEILKAKKHDFLEPLEKIDLVELKREEEKFKNLSSVERTEKKDEISKKEKKRQLERDNNLKILVQKRMHIDRNKRKYFRSMTILKFVDEKTKVMNAKFKRLEKVVQLLLESENRMNKKVLEIQGRLQRVIHNKNKIVYPSELPTSRSLYRLMLLKKEKEFLENGLDYFTMRKNRMTQNLLKNKKRVRRYEKKIKQLESYLHEEEKKWNRKEIDLKKEANNLERMTSSQITSLEKKRDNILEDLVMTRDQFQHQKKALSFFKKKLKNVINERIKRIQNLVM